MKNIKRADIHIFAQHSNLRAAAAKDALQTFVYPNPSSWQKFLRIFCLCLGVGFSILGIVFFFAYNWADMHKFAKVGLIEVLVLAITLLAIYTKLSVLTRNVLLSGSSLLVGVLFSVFGQIYQTGANAYDFFLAWTLFITIWVLTANFAPLWLCYMLLVNITLLLYEQQVSTGLSETLFYTILFLLNGSVALTAIVLRKKYHRLNIPTYSTDSVALASVAFATIGAIEGIFDHDHVYLALLSVIIVVLYTVGIRYAFKRKNGFYLAVFSFSLVVIVSSLFVRLIEDITLYLFVSVFIILSVTFIVNNLIKLQKTDQHGT